MNVVTSTTGTKFWSEVRDGDATLYTTPQYLTERMAHADAYCWRVFREADPTFERVRQIALAVRAKMDAENTVTVSSGTHVIPWEMAHELRKPAPHPNTGFAGTYGSRMRSRQKLFIDAATLLGIPYREAQTLPSILRANKH
jgi:hypothetical protein